MSLLEFRCVVITSETCKNTSFIAPHRNSVALSLLLVFRTDASYGRWVEALALWSDIASAATDLSASSAAFIKDKRLKELIHAWTMAYCRCLESYLKPGCVLKESLEPLLGPVAVQRLCQAGSHGPRLCLQVLLKVVRRAELCETHEQRMMTGEKERESNLFSNLRIYPYRGAAISSLNKMISSIEKLLQYPIPLSYTR